MSKICPQCNTEYPDDQLFCPKDGSTLKGKGGAADLVGSIIQKVYHVKKKLGEGGMGTVYLAEHVKMGRKAALKVMNPGMHNDADAISRFNREAANATMIDSDNVLLLRPATAMSGFSLESKARPLTGSNETRSELIVATIYYLDATADPGLVEFFEKTMRPVVTGSGATVLSYFVTEHIENTFPALPVREGVNVFVWFARFNDPAAYERQSAVLIQFPRWRDEISKELARRLKREPEILKLSPTTRSLL